jgi:hypothetical protein
MPRAPAEASAGLRIAAANLCVSIIAVLSILMSRCHGFATDEQNDEAVTGVAVPCLDLDECNR